MYFLQFLHQNYRDYCLKPLLVDCFDEKCSRLLNFLTKCFWNGKVVRHLENHSRHHYSIKVFIVQSNIDLTNNLVALCSRLKAYFLKLVAKGCWQALSCLLYAVCGLDCMWALLNLTVCGHSWTSLCGYSWTFCLKALLDFTVCGHPWTSTVQHHTGLWLKDKWGFKNEWAEQAAVAGNQQFTR